MLADFEGFLRSSFFAEVIIRLSDRRSVSDGHGLLRSCSFIDRIQDDHVPMTLNAIRFHGLFILYGHSKTVNFRRKLVGDFECFVNLALANSSSENAVFVERKSRTQREPSFCPLNKNERGQHCVVRRTALHNQATQKL